jgi:galactokinase
MPVSPEAPAAGARDRALARFRERWGVAPAHLIRSPGRVLLMGEHTDYHDGLALTVAIPQGSWLALRARSDGKVLIESEGREGAAEIDLQALRKGDGAWPDYVKGVAATLQAAGARVCGWEGCVASDLPEGAGLASSSSFALALARAFAVAAGAEWHPVAAAHVAQQAERKWVGAPCAAADVLALACAVGVSTRRSALPGGGGGGLGRAVVSGPDWPFVLPIHGPARMG